MKSSDLGVEQSDGVNKNKGETSRRVSVKRRRTSETDNVKSIVLETRSSPRTFYNSISTLKPNQKACLEQIGFGNFVEFKVDGIPSKLGLYVVDKFDAKKMEMKLAEGVIKITKNLISEMLGIRNEGIDIMAEEGNRNEEMVSSWMMQYGNKKDITPGDIKLRIRKSNSADMNFKLNFIVLFTSVMGQIKPKGFCDLKILDYIRPDTNLANINWCEYVLRCLQTCKEDWTKGKKNCFFRGPLTFLTMAYVDGSKCSSVNVIRKRPPTVVWTSELLREREDEELNSGGFGFGEIEGPFVEQEDPMPDNVEGFFWNKCSSVNVIRKRPPTVVWTSELLREREGEELNSGGFRFGEIEGPFVEQEDPMPDNVEDHIYASCQANE
uniref:Major facilitator superfamily domain, general substrate transporter n=1 Tax=Tanacetum cinerariifolium TaxID=118510 RepID=A0A699K766_TANCI|nr:major facilitator superfamily domain, general substrate transporter [Tanacetum cinerariifolium]